MWSLQARRRRADQGIALMLVLWVVALLTIIAIGLTAAQRTETALASNQVASARFRALADAGIRFTVLNLAATPLAEDATEDLWIPDGTVRTLTFAGEKLEIAVFNEGSRINLNLASRDLLRELLLAAQVSEEEADPLVDAILDWRDEDDLHLINGAEDDDYYGAGLPFGAKDEAFQSVDELQQVLGFDRALYRLVAPALTVDTESASVKEELASALVLAALKGVSVEDAEILIQEGVIGSGLTDDGSQTRTLANIGGPLYRILVTWVADGVPTMAMETLVRVDRAQTPPFRVVWRRYRMSADQPAATDAEDDG